MEWCSKYISWIFIALLDLSCFWSGSAADCRGSDVDSGGTSWIEATRALPRLRLTHIAARFCSAEPVMVQIWDPKGNNQYQLLWQTELQPEKDYLGQVQVFPVPEEAQFDLTPSLRYGLTARGTFPVDAIFDRDRRTGRLSVSSVDSDVITIHSDGGTRRFDELTRPVYFDVWFCDSRECPTEEELIRSYEEMQGPGARSRDNVTDAPPDSCRVGSLHAAGGRIMMEEHRAFLPRIIQAVQFYLCDDTQFHLHLWEPVGPPGTRRFRLIWSKDIIPDEGSGGGYRRTITLEDEEVVYLQPHYRLGLHVPDEHKPIPVPSTFSYSENAVFSERKKEKFHRCDSQDFEEVAFPYNFRIRLCSTKDCSDSETWTADAPETIDSLPAIDCPATPDPTTTIQGDGPEGLPQNNNDAGGGEASNSEAGGAGGGGTGNERDEDDEVNRTKDSESGADEMQEVEEPPRVGKSKNSTPRDVINLTLLGMCLWVRVILHVLDV